MEHSEDNILGIFSIFNDAWHFMILIIGQSQIVDGSFKCWKHCFFILIKAKNNGKTSKFLIK